ncbi:MAG: twin-arginine translocase subunit TatB [Hyphomonadaceae bacterium]|nr:twin-arginine translocase subunit TatB [Hyphomonadaceae bacterium]
MPQIGFAEMLLIAILALIVVGPKDLPVMMRKAGNFFGKIKAMGQEFKDAFNQIGADDEMAELRKEIEELKSLGKMSNLSDEAFEEDMRALDRDLRDSTDIAKVTSQTKTSKPVKKGDDG